MVSTNKPNVLLRKSVITRCLCLDHTHLALTRCSSWAAKLNIQYLFSRWDRGMCLMLVQSVRFLSFPLWATKANCMHAIFFPLESSFSFSSSVVCILFMLAISVWTTFLCLIFLIFLAMQWMRGSTNVYLCMIRRNSIEFSDSLVNRFTFCLWNCYHSLTNMKKELKKQFEWVSERRRRRKGSGARWKHSKRLLAISFALLTCLILRRSFNWNLSVFGYLIVDCANSAFFALFFLSELRCVFMRIRDRR